MEPISKIILDKLRTLTTNGVRRIAYAPYKMDTALSVVNRIGRGLEPDFVMSDKLVTFYEEIIKWFHGDVSFNGSIDKGILLMGPTGTGKTLAMQIMKIYQTIDNIAYVLKDKVVRMNYDIIDVSHLVTTFLDSGYDGIEMYRHRYALCIDDIGSETNRVKYYGNELDVVGYLVAERYAASLLTFGTTNYDVDDLGDKYGDRIISRMHALFNFIELRGSDFRITSKKQSYESRKTD